MEHSFSVITPKSTLTHFLFLKKKKHFQIVIRFPPSFVVETIFFGLKVPFLGRQTNAPKVPKQNFQHVFMVMILSLKLVRIKSKVLKGYGD